MKRVIIIPTLTLLVVWTSWSQKVLLDGQLITDYESATLNAELEHYDVYKINTQTLGGFKLQRTGQVLLQLNFPNQSPWLLNLSANELRGDDYQFFVQSRTDQFSTPTGSFQTYEGEVVDRLGQSARFTLDDGYLMGAIDRNGTWQYIEPVTNFSKKAPADYYVVYDATDVRPLPGSRHCLALQAEDRDHVVAETANTFALTTANCALAEIALAADYSMVEKYGDVYEAERQIISILNLVETNFTDDFIVSLEFKAVKTVVSECPDCDPWTASTDAFELLQSFTDWGIDSVGFGETPFDMASLWTTRVLNDTIVGLAWNEEACSDYRFGILQDLTSNAEILRMVQAHEFGHLLGAPHDTEDFSNIMSPRINTSNTWSPYSKFILDRAILRYSAPTSCFGPCADLSAPNVDFSAAPSDDCAPQDIQFQSQVTGEAVAQKWLFEGGEPAVSFDENPMVNYSAPGIYSVTLMALNSAGEDMEVKTGYIEIQGAPDARFDFDYTIGEQAVSFQGQSPDLGVSFFWDFGDGIVTNQTQPVHEYAESGAYNVMMIASGDCGNDTVSQSVTVITAPLAAFEASNTVGCAPLEVAFNNLSTNFQGNYQWIFDGATVDTSSMENPTVTYDTPGSYEVTLMAINPAGTDTLTQSSFIEVFQLPVANFNVDTTLGSSIVRVMSEATNNDSVSWIIDGLEVEANAPFTVDLETPGMHNITMIAVSGCGADTMVMMPEVFDFPISSFDATPKIGCAPLDVNMEDFSSGYKIDYNWLFPGAEVDTSSMQQPVVRYQNVGIYDVSLEVSNLAGSELIEKPEFIQVIDVPEAEFMINYSFGDSTVYFADTSLVGQRFFWDFGDGNTSQIRNPSHTYEVDGTYDVTLVVENECGRDSVLRSVDVLFNPSAAFTYTNASGCSPLTVDYNSLIGNNFGSILWVFDGGFPNESIEERPTVVYEEPGVYNVQMVVFNSIGLDSLVLEAAVKVDPVPVPSFTMQVDRNVVQFNNSTDFGDEFYWEFGDGTNSSAPNPVHNYGSPGSYLVTLTAINSCDSAMVTENLVISTSRPRAGFSSSVTEGCGPLTVQFINESFNVQDYMWYFPGGEPEFSSDSTPVVVYAEPGIYAVELSVSNSAGSALAEKEEFIKVLSRPEAGFTYEINDLTISTTNTSMNADDYIWIFGDGFGSDEVNPTYTFAEKGSYTVSLIARNSCGRDTLEVLVDFNSTSINKEPDWAREFNIFPNPNNGVFNIQATGLPISGELSAALYDFTGRAVESFVLRPVNGSVDQRVETSGLSAGVYLIKITDQKQTFYRKISIY